MLLSKYLLLYIDLTIAWKLVILIYNLSRDIISYKPALIPIVSASLIIGHFGSLWRAKQYWPSTTNPLDKYIYHYKTHKLLKYFSIILLDLKASYYTLLYHFLNVYYSFNNSLKACNFNIYFIQGFHQQ